MTPTPDPDPLDRPGPAPSPMPRGAAALLASPQKAELVAAIREAERLSTIADRPTSAALTDAEIADRLADADRIRAAIRRDGPGDYLRELRSVALAALDRQVVGALAGRTAPLIWGGMAYWTDGDKLKRGLP